MFKYFEEKFGVFIKEDFSKDVLEDIDRIERECINSKKERFSFIYKRDFYTKKEIREIEDYLISKDKDYKRDTIKYLGEYSAYE